MMNIQKAFRKQPPKVWIKLATLIMIVLSTAALLTIHVVSKNLEEDNKNQEQQYIEESQTNDKLQGYLDNAGTDEGVKDVATNELGMVGQDTTIYDFD